MILMLTGALILVIGIGLGVFGMLYIAASKNGGEDG